MGTHVFSPERGVRRLKAGISLSQYQVKFPKAIKVCKPPSFKTLEEWSNACGCESLDGCWVEPDGQCEHGYPSWLRAMNLI